MRRISATFALFLLLGLGGMLIHERPAGERLDRAARELQQRVDRSSEELAARARNTVEANSLDMGAAHEPGEGGVRLYKEGTVTAWTDHAPISDEELGAARAGHLVLLDGIYLHAVAGEQATEVHAVQRVWFQPPFENQYLKRHFDPGFRMPKGIIAVSGQDRGAPVLDAQGQEMFRLQWADDEPLPGRRSLASLLLLLAAFGAAVAALWQWALRLRNPWTSLAAFLALIAGLRLFTLARASFPLDGLALFDPSLFASSFLMPSLGDLLINAALLLCGVLFLRQVLARVHPRSPAWLPAAAALLVIFAMALAIHAVIVALVHDSSVPLDLLRVQDWNVYSVVALLIIALLLFAWCVLAEALIRPLSARTPRLPLLLMAVATALLVIGLRHAAGRYDLLPALWPLLATALIHRLHQRTGTLPALLLIAVLAFVTAHSLNRETVKRTAMDREAIAESTVANEDPVVELLFGEAKGEMASNQALLTWIRRGAPCSSTDLDRSVRQPFFSGYWDRYDLRLHLVGPREQRYCTTSPDPTSSAHAVISRFEQGVPTGKHHDLRMTGRPGEDALYMGQVMLDSTRLFLELRPRLVADGLGFPELLLAGQRPSLLAQNRFVEARYARGLLTSSSGSFTFPVEWTREVPTDGLYWREGGYELMAQGDPHGALVVLGSPIPSWWDHLTTFSYIFLFFTLLTGLAAGTLLLFRKNRVAAMGVSGKVRLGMAGFALVGLLLFAFGMLRMIDVRQQQRSTRTLGERTRGVLAELRQNLQLNDALTPVMAPYLDHLLGNLSNVFFTDLTLYDTDGLVFATSREQVFNTGLLGRRMDPRAFRRLAIEGASSYVGREHIGDAGFTTTYMPFRNEQGHVMAYLALPYFARQAEVEQARASGYVALVNLFTLLFLLSVVAAALIMHWTTRPLELLRRSLERIDLGARNEPIPYRGNDELGQLVRVYNSKVEELRESALKLARSERESAWREMAKQVAHEIKNPLTPMKLNIQQFQRTWDPQAPDAKQRLDRFSNGLVEQIDVLSRIAGEFSHFAQIPPAKPEEVDLVETARAAVQLFADTPDFTVGFHGDGPLPVLADREHLLRVFNNLIKNALQAIPDGSEGRVDVLLRREGNEAVAEVRDNGTGIATEDRERIFQPSFTTKGSGMGLGLAMVKRMVENAGGRVWFETQEGRGTSFFVALSLKHVGQGPGQP